MIKTYPIQTYTPDDVAEVTVRYEPDWRKCWVVTQLNASGARLGKTQEFRLKRRALLTARCIVSAAGGKNRVHARVQARSTEEWRDL